MTSKIIHNFLIFILLSLCLMTVQSYDSSSSNSNYMNTYSSSYNKYHNGYPYSYSNNYDTSVQKDEGRWLWVPSSSTSSSFPLFNPISSLVSIFNTHPTTVTLLYTAIWMFAIVGLIYVLDFTFEFMGPSFRSNKSFLGIDFSDIKKIMDNIVDKEIDYYKKIENKI